MSNFKLLATLSWEFEAESSHEATIKGHQLLDALVGDAPPDDDHKNFSLQMELLPLKRRPASIQQEGELTPDEVFSWIDAGFGRKTITVNGQDFEVKLNSDRYLLFKENRSCVVCGLRGEKFILEHRGGSTTAFLNLYAVENGRDVLMTKDHKIPKAYGGKDLLVNLAPTCTTCNALKSSFPISYKNVKVLREMLKNENHLPAKELRKKINDARLLMVDFLNGQ